MTLNEAIRRLERHIGYAKNIVDENLEDALKLGIEALKQIKAHRSGQPLLLISLLPRETAE